MPAATRFSTLFILLLLVSAAPRLQAQTILYVDASATGAGDGSSWQDAFPALQDAFDEANANASTDYEFRIAEGVYYPDEENVDNGVFEDDHIEDDLQERFMLARDGVEIYGGYPSGGGTRDAEQHRAVLSGDITQDDADPNGDGIIESGDDINDTDESENSLTVLLLDGTATGTSITAATVIDGITVTAAGGFGGLECNGPGSGSVCSPVVRNAVFAGSAAVGGAIYSNGINGGESSPVLENVIFSGNTGYAMRNFGDDGASNPVLIDVTFIGNSGGMFNSNTSNLTLMNATFAGNEWAMFNGSDSEEVEITLTNVAFTGNGGQAIFGGAMGNEATNLGAIAIALINVTFAGNTAPRGGAIGSTGDVDLEIRNTIFFGNRAGLDEGNQIYHAGSGNTISFSYSLFEGGPNALFLNGVTLVDDGGNIEDDPQFADADGPDDILGTLDDDLRLRGPDSPTGASPCIDAGSNSAVPDGVTTDLAGMSRFQDVEGVPDMGDGGAPVVDMGAYESDGSALPVELAAFTAALDGEAVLLQWQTANETGNAGFAVQHRRAEVGEASEGAWQELAFLASKAPGGTSTEALGYAHRAEGLPYGRHLFRLKQVDIDGTERLSAERAVEITLAEAFALSAPAPNPFRRSATFTLAVRETQEVQARVYDVLGRRVAVLYEGPMAAGQAHRLRLEAGRLASGLYLVRITGERFAPQTRRVVLMR